MIVRILCAVLILVSLLGPYIYSYYTMVSDLKHYTLQNFEKIERIRISCALILSLLNFIMFFYITLYESLPRKLFIQLLLLTAAIEEIWSIRIILRTKSDKYDRIIMRETSLLFQKKGTQMITEQDWKIIRAHFDAIKSGQKQYDFEALFPFIMVEKYIAMGGAPLFNCPPPSLTLHPYYPEFKKRVEQIEVIDILKNLRERDGSTKLLKDLINAWELKNSKGSN